MVDEPAFTVTFAVKPVAQLLAMAKVAVQEAAPLETTGVAEPVRVAGGVGLEEFRAVAVGLAERTAVAAGLAVRTGVEVSVGVREGVGLTVPLDVGVGVWVGPVSGNLIVVRYASLVVFTV